MARFQVRINEDALVEIKDLPAFARKQVIRAIENQLPHQPDVPTRNRKLLRGLVPPWEHIEPTWEIRVGEYRVFYDIDEESEGGAYSISPAQAAAYDHRRNLMKTLDLEETDLSRCAKEATSSSVLVLKNGKPLALVSNVEGLDAEQIELGSTPDFWKLIQRRREQKTVRWEDALQRLQTGSGKRSKRSRS